MTMKLISRDQNQSAVHKLASPISSCKPRLQGRLMTDARPQYFGDYPLRVCPNATYKKSLTVYCSTQASTMMPYIGFGKCWSKSWASDCCILRGEPRLNRKSCFLAGQRRGPCIASTSTPSEGSGGNPQSAGDPNLQRLDVELGMSPEAAALQVQHDLKAPRSFWGKVKRLFVGEKLDRKRLAALGERLRLQQLL